MGVPNSYLFSRVDGETDYFGSPIHHKVMVAGLKVLNPKVWCFDEYPDGYFWPGRYTEMPGTTLWMGAPMWACDNVPTALSEAQMIKRNSIGMAIFCRIAARKGIYTNSTEHRR